MSLHSQLQFIEQLCASGRALQAAPLEALFVQTHPVPAQAWSDLAWVQLRLGAVEAALPLLEKAYAIDAQCLQALDGLAEVHARLGAFDEARRFGLAALDAKDALTAGTPVAPSPSPPPAGVSAHATTQSGQRVLAFSLFGLDAFYSECAVRNAADVARWYPGWVCRFYVGSDVCEEVRARLKAHGAQVLAPPAAHAQLPGTVWRFLALDDAQVSHVMCRDADSQIGAREVGAVQDWLASGCAAHVMRDDYKHTELLLAGLWGAQTTALRGIGAALLRYFAHAQHASHGDQHFLRDWVWPRVRASVRQHDRCYRWRGAQDFAQPLAAPEHAAGIALHDEVQLNPPAGMVSSGATDLAYTLNSVNSQGETAVLGRYRVVRGASGFTCRLPAGYHAQLASGALVIRFAASTKSSH